MQQQRPPFVLTADSVHDEEPALGEGGASRQQSELQPGEIRRPGVHPPTPLVDWGRGDSLMWDSQFGSETPVNNMEQQQQQQKGGSPGTRSPQTAGVHSPTSAQEPGAGTPLTGYGRGDNLWGRSPTTSTEPASGKDNVDGHKLFPGTSGHHHPTSSGGKSGSEGRHQDIGLNSAPPQRGGGGGGANSGHGGGRPSFPEPIHDAPHAHFGEDVHGGDGGHSLGYRQESAISHRQDSSISGGMRQDTSLLAFQFRTQSQILSDELYFQSMWFPPPPPPRVPKESRRTRSELWYYYASKWDITHIQPPPPRCPLALMEEEHAQGLAPQSKVPYRGEYWLDRCNHWFKAVQENFQPPEHHSPLISDPKFVVDRCICN